MKNKLLVSAIVFLISCTPVKFIEKVEPGQTFVSFLDFQPYLSKGFTFSTGSINQNYTPIGLIDNIAYADVVKTYKYINTVVTDKMIADGDVIFEGEESYLIHSSTEDQKKSYNDILKDIYDFSISKGANGIIELKLSRNEKQMIEVSGTMVKISK